MLDADKNNYSLENVMINLNNHTLLAKDVEINFVKNIMEIEESVVVFCHHKVIHKLLHESLQEFNLIAQAEIERIQNTAGLFTTEFPENLIHFSVNFLTPCQSSGRINFVKLINPSKLTVGKS